jgi:hypothetical protein
MNADGADIRILPLVGSAIKQVTEKLKNGDFNVANITKPIVLTCALSMLEAVSKFKMGKGWEFCLQRLYLLLYLLISSSTVQRSSGAHAASHLGLGRQLAFQL